MAKLVLEITEKEKKALEKSKKEVRGFFRKIAGAFKLRVIKDDKKR